MLPFVVALCPTFRRPKCLANSLWLWEHQTYPADRRFLIIADDGGTWPSQVGNNWKLESYQERFTHFPHKYNALASLAPPETDAFLIWEDDDVYLPRYVEAHSNVLLEHEFSKSKRVFSNYPGHLDMEDADGRFFSSIGFRKSLLDRLGGFGNTLHADYDQQFLSKVRSSGCSVGDPWSDATIQSCQFVYGWQTGHPHSQSTMKGGDDVDYYHRNAEIFKPVKADKLTPCPMEWVLDIFEQLGY